MNRKENAKKGIVFGILNNIVGLLLPFVSRTVIIYILGNEFVGLSGLFTSIINTLSITELGFGTAISYILYNPIANKDDERVRAILNFSRNCFRIIGVVVLAFGVAVIPFLNKLISSGYPDGINIYILYLFYLANSVISYFAFSYKRVLFSATQRYDIEANINTVALLLQYAAQIVILIVTKNYYFHVVMMVLATFMNNLMCGYMTKKIYPQYYCAGRVTKDEINEVKKQVGGAFFSKLGATIYLSADNIVISAVFGLSVLGQYGNYFYIISALISLFAVIHNTVRPIYGNCIITEGVKNNFERFETFNYLYIYLSALCTCCLLCLFQDFINIWVGVNNMFGIQMVVLFALYFYVGRIACVPTLFSESAGLWWEARIIPLLAAFINLGMNIVLSNTIGIEGVLISSIISSLFVNLVGYTRILFKNYFNIVGELKLYIIQTTKITMISMVLCGITYAITYQFHVSSWMGLVLKGIVVVVLFAGVLILLNCRNKQLYKAFSLIKKTLIKKRG